MYVSYTGDKNTPKDTILPEKKNHPKISIISFFILGWV